MAMNLLVNGEHGAGPRHAAGWLAACALAALAPLVAVAAEPGADPGKHYSWVDNRGERHYGDVVPPEYAQSERRVLNSQGVEVNRLEASKTDQQLAEQRRLEEEAAARAQHDRFLLTTYTSTRDIERLRDERLDQINGQIKATTAYIDTLMSRTEGLAERALSFKPYSTKPDAQRMPDDLAEDLVRASNEVRSQRRSLDLRVREQDEVRTQFEADITRYRELTSRNRG